MRTLYLFGEDTNVDEWSSWKSFLEQRYWLEGKATYLDGVAYILSGLILVLVTNINIDTHTIQGLFRFDFKFTVIISLFVEMSKTQFRDLLQFKLDCLLFLVISACVGNKGENEMRWAESNWLSQFLILIKWHAPRKKTLKRRWPNYVQYFFIDSFTLFKSSILSRGVSFIVDQTKIAISV